MRPRSMRARLNKSVGKPLSHASRCAEHTAAVEQACRIILLLDLQKSLEVLRAPDLLGLAVWCTIARNHFVSSCTPL